jgi:hypothetical protein
VAIATSCKTILYVGRESNTVTELAWIGTLGGGRLSEVSLLKRREFPMFAGL